jgi:hypothetical protein
VVLVFHREGAHTGTLFCPSDALLAGLHNYPYAIASRVPLLSIGHGQSYSSALLFTSTRTSQCIIWDAFTVHMDENESRLLRTGLEKATASYDE